MKRWVGSLCFILVVLCFFVALAEARYRRAVKELPAVKLRSDLTATQAQFIWLSLGESLPVEVGAAGPLVVAVETAAGDRLIVKHAGRRTAFKTAQQLPRSAGQSAAKHRQEQWLRSIQLAREIEDGESLVELFCGAMYFGYGNRGIHSASDYYFARPTSELDVTQLASLVAIMQAPTYNDPYCHPARVLRVRDRILEEVSEDLGLDVDYETPLGFVTRECR